MELVVDFKIHRMKAVLHCNLRSGDQQEDRSFCSLNTLVQNWKFEAAQRSAHATDFRLDGKSGVGKRSPRLDLSEPEVRFFCEEVLRRLPTGDV